MESKIAFKGCTRGKVGLTTWSASWLAWWALTPTLSLMTHKYRGCIIVLLINKSVEPNEEQKVLMSGFDQGFTVNTSK
jgi:hypothetical protein